jgi:peroxiredoxin
MKTSMEVENFQLMDQFNNIFDLYENLGQNVLLFFYPKDITPLFTKYLVDYSLNLEELK